MNLRRKIFFRVAGLVFLSVAAACIAMSVLAFQGPRQAWETVLVMVGFGAATLTLGFFTAGGIASAATREMEQRGQELIRLERLRALGEMSAGVSHNLNNILTCVLGPAQLLQRATDDPEVLQWAKEIVKSTLRARDLVRRLHTATRGTEEGELQPVAVNEVVEDAVRAARCGWKDELEAKGVSVEVVMDLEDVPSARGTRLGLCDILANLLHNATDAMPRGGTVTIGTQAVDGGVQIAVSDTGVGMDEEIQRRVFDPFFTTRMDVGSGLGLSMAYGAVTRWGGKIEVESEPGRGTTFTILLPVWAEPEIRGKGSVEIRHDARIGIDVSL